MEIINVLMIITTVVFLIATISFIVIGSIAVAIMMWHEFKKWWRNKS